MSNYDDMTTDELRKLRAEIDAAIEVSKERVRKNAMAAAEEAARAHGFSLGEITMMARRARLGTGSPRYANPENPVETWSGRGRRPQWMVDLIARGENPEVALISKRKGGKLKLGK